MQATAMVLMLTNQDMERIEGLETTAVIAAVADAYRDLGEGTAVNPPRRRLTTPQAASGATYWFNNIMGAVPAIDTLALRIDSTAFRMETVNGLSRKVRAGDFVGLVFLFNTA